MSNRIPDADLPARERLARYIRHHGPIPAVRVSSAQASGKAGEYSYWGATRYQITLTADGLPMSRAEERASSDRRSERLAYADAIEIAESEGRVCIGPIGRLADIECERVLYVLYQTHRLAA